MTSTSALSIKEGKKTQQPSRNNLGKRTSNSTFKDSSQKKGENFQAAIDDIIGINQEEIKKTKYEKKNENENTVPTEENSNQTTTFNDLCYRLKNKSKEFVIKFIDGKME